MARSYSSRLGGPAAIGAMLAMLTAGAEAQAVLTLKGGATCAECRIQLVPSAVLGEGEAGLRPDGHAIVAVDSRGGYFVFPTTQQGRLAYYAADGRFVRSVGSPGAGPQEFDIGSVRMAVSPGDTLFVIKGPFLHTVLPEARGLLDKTRLPSSNALPVWTAHGLLAQYKGPRGKFYHQLRSPSGEPRSFGDEPAMRSPYDWVRKMAPALDGGFWSGAVNRYELERWTADGRHVLTIRREASWFEPWVDEPPGVRVTAPPNPQLSGVRERADGRLWSLTAITDPDWQPVPRPAGEARERNYENPVSRKSMIELVDPGAAQVVATARSERGIGFVIGATDLVYDIGIGPDGDWEVQIFRLVLRSPNQ
ncbi:MAG: hypothetical protein WEB88_04640 [Gemmatimonadota bacterium]